MSKKMSKILKYLAVATLGIVAPLATVPAFAQDTKDAKEKASGMKVEKAAKLPTVTIVFSAQETWETNYPEWLFPASQRKSLRKPSKKYARIIRESKGYYVSKTENDATRSYPLASAVKIEWPDNDPRLATAQNELNRGNPSGALEVAETFLTFFSPLKSIEGSPWIRAAAIKLDALDQQGNDTSLQLFISEITAVPNYKSIEGLPQKIELARLNQLVRKGENAMVLNESDRLIKTTYDTELLARLHLLKGNALYNLSRYEEALLIYLRIPVFYGNQVNFVPAAKLAIARCLKRMDRPETKSMNLPARSEEYLMEIIQKYPMSLEAKAALAELPQHKREAALAKSSLEEQAAAKAAVTSQMETSESESDSDSDEEESSDDSGGSDE